MPNYVTMPQLSETMKDGKLLRWCVAPGDYVYEGDALAEIEADKANMELEALTAGTVKELLARPGETIAVGAVVAVLEEGSPRESSGTKGNRASGEAASAAITASPLAQRMAAERQVDLSQVEGTGPGGAITPQDIEKFAPQPKADS